MSGRDAYSMRGLGLPLSAFFLLLAAGAGLAWTQHRALEREHQQLGAARVERANVQGRLQRIAEEEREVSEKLALYRRLEDLRILGAERRLEWVDAMARIGAQRELPDLRYQVERQRLLKSVPGKPANIDFHASTMNVDLALLHEGDLFRFLHDLRASGNAYYSVRRCSIRRTAEAPAGRTVVPRLRAACQIDLITILDHAAGT